MPAWASTLQVTDPGGMPLAQVMVTRTPQEQKTADLSDDGYAPHGVTNTAAAVITRFTNSEGGVPTLLRIRPLPQ